MPSHDQAGIGSEHPYSHEIQLGSIIIFAFIWSVDTFILQLGEDLKQSIWFGFPTILYILLRIIVYMQVKTVEGV
ncbi:MAG: hypothetical protein ACXACP_05290 [Candidatus Hodarchaeales archaeon]|jgi:hypothetical protein